MYTKDRDSAGTDEKVTNETSSTVSGTLTFPYCLAGEWNITLIKILDSHLLFISSVFQLSWF